MSIESQIEWSDESFLHKAPFSLNVRLSTRRMCVFSLLRIRYLSTPMLKLSKGTAFLCARAHGLSAPRVPTSVVRWQLFCQFIFCCALVTFRSRAFWLYGRSMFWFFIKKLLWQLTFSGFVPSSAYLIQYFPLLLQIVYTVFSIFPSWDPSWGLVLACPWMIFSQREFVRGLLTVPFQARKYLFCFALCKSTSNFLQADFPR